MVIQLGVTTVKKISLCISYPCLREGRGGWNGQCDLVCGAPLNDWAKASYVDAIFTCGESGFNFGGSWSFSKE